MTKLIKINSDNLTVGPDVVGQVDETTPINHLEDVSLSLTVKLCKLYTQEERPWKELTEAINQVCHAKYVIVERKGMPSVTHTVIFVQLVVALVATYVC